MESLLTQGIANGLVSAGIYILVALGLALVLSIMGIVQLAHGEIYMLGGYAAYCLCNVIGLNFFVSVLLSALLVGCLGVVIEKIFFRPYRGQFDRGMIMAMGLILLLQSAVQIITGGASVAFTSPLSGVVTVLNIKIPWERLVCVLIGIILVAAVFLLIAKTRIGQAMLAVSQDREVASLQGISVDNVYSTAMFLGCALAAVAGALVGSLYNLNPFMGGSALMEGIAIIILGGLGSIPGTIIGGLVIGLLEGIITPFASASVAGLVVFGTIILIMIFRPRGISGMIGKGSKVG